jgi:hypothetical protein
MRTSILQPLRKQRVLKYVTLIMSPLKGLNDVKTRIGRVVMAVIPTHERSQNKLNLGVNWLL